MRIAIVGCGAVGSFYGARLLRAGEDVHFLLRSDYEVVRREGVRILSIEGDFIVRPVAARRPEEIGPCDWVIIALKTTANHAFGELLPPLVGPQTRLLTLQNGLGNEEALAALFGPERVLGGLCFVCLNRIAPGVIRHMAHGHIVLGEFQRPPGPDAHRIADAFQRAGIRCRVADNLERAHWEKLVWNIPFNGVGVAGIVGQEALLAGRVPETWTARRCLPTDELLADPGWERLVRELMAEVIAVGRALGHDIPDSFADENIERTRCMGDYRASTLLDFEKGMPLELESLFLEPQRVARRLGVPTPRLDALCAVLCELDARRAAGRLPETT
ncbi:MAG: 2-dehydropantoate 2-reductase [Verrucomicrobia bacterium]|nr:MAG: 2-dehydropantoate 2-reductase [Verrucomicrobiota bacterium]